MSDEEKQPEPEPEEIELPDPFADFDPELFVQPPTVNWEERPLSGADIADKIMEFGVCPFKQTQLCDKAGTSFCREDCEHNPCNFMDEHIREVFEREPWSNYCFDCDEFVPSRAHEDALDPPKLVYSHLVATGFEDYKEKLTQWTIKRMTGK